MRDFRQLQVWKQAHELTLNVYRASEPFPSSERYGLTSQMRRAASSVAANIAEGCGRGNDGDMARSLQIAAGSLTELEYHLLLCRDLALIQVQVYESLRLPVEELQRMLASLLRKIATDRLSPARIASR